MRNVSASLVVFLIAVPLSLGIALATGAPLQAGLVAAAVGGIVAALLGGVPLMVSGPTASLTLITADLVQRYGWQATCAVTVAAGLLQILLGAVRVARAALAVSPAIVHGMLAGIGITIAVSQLHIVLGGSPHSSTLDNLRELPSQLGSVGWSAALVGAVTVAVALLWPRLPGRVGERLKSLPAPLAAITAATLLTMVAGLPAERVRMPSWDSHLFPAMPEGAVPGLLAAVVTVAAIGSVESLLSAVALDRLHSGPRARLDRELIGQGAANTCSGALGGLPVAGVAVRSLTNLRAGATGRWSAVLHGVWVAVAALLLVGLLEAIPLAGLAGLVLVVGVRMVDVAHARQVRRHGELAPYLVTFAAVVVLGVLEGVAVGVATAGLLALRRLAGARIHVEHLDPDEHQTEHQHDHDHEHQTQHQDQHDKQHQKGASHRAAVRVSVSGPLTFLTVPRLSRVLGALPAGLAVRVELAAEHVDQAAHEALASWRSGHESGGGRVRIAHVRRDCCGRTRRYTHDRHHDAHDLFEPHDRHDVHDRHDLHDPHDRLDPHDPPPVRLHRPTRLGATGTGHRASARADAHHPAPEPEGTNHPNSAFRTEV